MYNLNDEQTAGLNELQDFENGIESNINIISKSKRSIYFSPSKNKEVPPSDSDVLDSLTILENQIFTTQKRQRSTQTLPGFYVGE